MREQDHTRQRQLRGANRLWPWVLVGAGAWVLRDVVLLLFAALLLAVFLRKLSGLLHRRLGLPEGFGLTLILVASLAVLAALVTWQGPRIIDEARTLQRELPSALEELRARVIRSTAAREVADELPTPTDLLGEGDELLERARTVATSTTAALTAFGLWVFLAVLLSATPRTYVDGILAVVPRGHEERARQIMHTLGETLWWWSLGRLMSMAFVGTATAIGLTLLGVPLAFLLGIIAALLSFVPNIGPILSAVPALLLALAGDPIDALWVALLYVGVQLVEGLVLDPLIDRMTVYLPPALTVTMQLVLGTLAGLAGVALAAPLTAVAMVLVSALWVEDALGKRGLPQRHRPSPG